MVFERNANKTIAGEQKAYMRNQFEYYGLKAPIRRALQKPFLTRPNLPEKSRLTHSIKWLWTRPQREYQHFGQELVFKYLKQFESTDLDLIEYMVTHKSWWDTVDYIAVKLIGGYFKIYPDHRNHQVQAWMESNNLWLQRSSLLFQLKYRNNLDTAFLSGVVKQLLGSNEFFINKAIGWVLREYSKTDPQWVRAFVEENTLAPLSKKEALRLIS